MRHFAITGIVTASWIALIIAGSDMRATPPCKRMSAGTRSSAIPATAPASSAIFACSALTTSMITPPLSISASPLLTRIVPVSCIGSMLAAGRFPTRCRVLFFGLPGGSHVRSVGPQVDARAVRELDADHGPLLLADDQAVGVDDLRLFVVLAVLGPRGQDAVTDLVGILDHAPDYRLYSDAVSEPEHPAANAGRLVRAVGLGIARELEKRAEAPPKARPEPPPPPPPADNGGLVGRLRFLGLLGSV